MRISAKPLVVLAWLAAHSLTGAVLAVEMGSNPTPPRIGTPASWAGPVGRAIHGWQDIHGISHFLGFEELRRLNYVQPLDAKRLELLIALIEPLQSGQTLTPEDFEELPPAHRQLIVGIAAEKAYMMANAKATKLLNDFKAGRVTQEGLDSAKKVAYAIHFEYAPYLSLANRNDIDLLVSHLNQAVDADDSQKVASLLERISRGLSGISPAQEAQAVSDQEFRGAKFPSISFPPAQERAPVPGTAGRWSLAKAARDQSALSAVKRRFEAPLIDSGRRNDEELFWITANSALTAMQAEIRKDGLDLIGRHALGPWAKAKISGYRKQIDALVDWIEGTRAKFRILDQEKRWFESNSRHFRHETKLYELVAGVEYNLTGREKGQRRDASEAAQTLTRLAVLEQADEGMAPHLFKLVDYYKKRVAEAKANPDPNHIALVRSQMETGHEDLPSLRRLWSLYSLSASSPHALAALEREALTWAVLSGVLGIMTAYAAALWPEALRVVPFLAAITLFVARYYGNQVSRFKRLGYEIRSLLNS